MQRVAGVRKDNVKTVTGFVLGQNPLPMMIDGSVDEEADVFDSSYIVQIGPFAEQGNPVRIKELQCVL